MTQPSFSRNRVPRKCLGLLLFKIIHMILIGFKSGEYAEFWKNGIYKFLLSFSWTILWSPNKQKNTILIRIPQSLNYGASSILIYRFKRFIYANVYFSSYHGALNYAKIIINTDFYSIEWLLQSDIFFVKSSTNYWRSLLKNISI